MMRWCLILLAALGAQAEPTEQQVLDAQLMEHEQKLNGYEAEEETDAPARPSRAEMEALLTDATNQLALAKTNLASCRAEMESLKD